MRVRLDEQLGITMPRVKIVVDCYHGPSGKKDSETNKRNSVYMELDKSALWIAANGNQQQGDASNVKQDELPHKNVKNRLDD